MRRERNSKKWEPVQPPVPAGRYLIEYLFEIGPVVSTGMGSAPITFYEIVHWSELTGIDLLPWEARFIRRLSSEYVQESHRATDRDAEEPWEERRALQAIRDQALKEE